MGKIWLKSVDQSQQCCGCEGKTSPCDNCCVPLKVELPKQAGIPTSISSDQAFKSSEKYYNCIFYSSIFDSWSKTNKTANGSISSPILTETALHSNKFVVNLQKNQTITLDLNFSYRLIEIPVGLSFDSVNNRFLCRSNSNFPFTVTVLIEDGATADDLQITTSNLNISSNNDIIVFSKTLEIEEDVLPPESVQKLNSPTLVVCPSNLVNLNLLANFYSPPVYLTTTKIQVATVEYSFINQGSTSWLSGGNTIITSDCSFFSDAGDCVIIEDLPSRIYGIYGEVTIDLPDPSIYPHNFIYKITVPYFYNVQYRALDKFSSDKSENSTISITANKNCCLTFDIFGSKNEPFGTDENICFPSSFDHANTVVNISSDKNIGFVKLKFEQFSQVVPCPE